MPNVAIPDGGWMLGAAAESISSKAPGTPNIAPGNKQLMRLTFAEPGLLEELIQHGEFKVMFGKTITFLYGKDQVQEILSKSEQIRSEVYEITDDSLNFTGLTTHQFEARRLEKEKEDAPDLVALKESMSAFRSKKAEKSTMILDSRGRAVAPAKLGRPAAPVKQLKVEPKVSKAAAAKMEAENQVKMDALRPPLIHLLALRSDTERNLAMKTHAPIDLCLRILQRIGNRTRAGNHWELVDNIYRDLDLWKFPYGSQKDRDLAIANQKAAFERLRLPVNAPEWDFLVEPGNRGKVSAAPPPPVLPRPKALPGIKVGKADDAVAPAELSPTGSDRSAAGDRLARSGSQQPPNKTRRVGEKDTIARIIANKGKTPKERKEKKEKAAPGTKKLGRPPKPKGEAAPKPVKRPVKWKHPEGGAAAAPTVSAYKSKEFVDSDSDIDDSTLKPSAKSPPVTAANKADGKSPLPKTNGRDMPDTPKSVPVTISPKKKAIESKDVKPGTSPISRKAGVATKTVPVRTPESTAEKAPARAALSTATAGKRPSAKAKDIKQAGKEQTSGKTTSPVKRSPLGSSPTVAENGGAARSISSTPKSLTSIGSTPSRSPFDSATSKITKPKSSQEMPSSSFKRKRAEEITASIPQPQSKRRQLDPSTITLAKRFKEEYARYAKLYEEVEKAAEGPNHAKMMNEVIKMHHDLKGMKATLTSLAAA